MVPSRIRRSFNSILVRLKDCRGLSICGIRWHGFNSILVRLKAGGQSLRQKPLVVFQFHTGSIKSGDWTLGTTSEIRFQFHTGSIKRRADIALVGGWYYSFNSILVRLKVWIGGDTCASQMAFQFHTGSIKSIPMRIMLRITICFNSILVRLKVKTCYSQSHFFSVSIPYWFD